MKNRSLINYALILTIVILAGISGMALNEQTAERTNYQESVVLLQGQIEDLNLLRTDAQDALNNLQNINERAIGIDAQLMKNTLGVQVDSGEIVINGDQSPELLEPIGCDGKRGILSQTVMFQRAFSSPPTIMLGLTELDFRFGQDSRLKASITSIANDSFVLDFYTWCDTKMSLAGLKWIAIGN